MRAVVTPGLPQQIPKGAGTRLPGTQCSLKNTFLSASDRSICGCSNFSLSRRRKSPAILKSTRALSSGRMGVRDDASLTQRGGGVKFI